MACIVFSLEDGTTFTAALEGEMVTIGRHPDNMVPLPSPSVSNHHAAIQLRPDGFYVHDLASRNGVRVNGAEIEEAMLNDGDRVSFGDVQALFYAADSAPEAPVVEAPVKPQPPVQKSVTARHQVANIPPHAGVQPPAPGHGPAYRRREEDGSGCMTAFLLTLLFVGAFLIGLTLRHYEQTKGGILPNDLVEKLFSKASKLHIESGDGK